MNYKKILILAAISNLLVWTGVYFWKKNDINKQIEAASLMGKTLQYEGVDFSKTDKTSVIYITTTCPHCKAMMPFYKELSKTSTPIIVVTPNKQEDMIAYVKDIKTKFILGNTNEVLGYPALAMVDASGKVIYWKLGRLTTEDQKSLLNMVCTEHCR